MVEPLEPRVLFAATIDHTGRLSIDGTAGRDVITVAPCGVGLLAVDINGQQSTFAAAAVRQIVVRGLAGNDQIAIAGDVNCPATICGGAGDDSLSAGSGDTVLIGGTGNDTLTAGAGDDTLLGGSGIDQLVAGAGNDSIDGGSGNDRVLFTAIDGTPLAAHPAVVRSELTTLAMGAAVQNVTPFRDNGRNYFGSLVDMNGTEYRIVTDPAGDIITDGPATADGLETDPAAHSFGTVVGVNTKLGTMTVNVGSEHAAIRQVAYRVPAGTTFSKAACGCADAGTDDDSTTVASAALGLADVFSGTLVRVDPVTTAPSPAAAAVQILAQPAGVQPSLCGGVIRTYIGTSTSNFSAPLSWNPNGFPTPLDAMAFPLAISLEVNQSIVCCGITIRSAVTLDMNNHSFVFNGDGLTFATSLANLTLNNVTSGSFNGLVNAVTGSQLTVNGFASSGPAAITLASDFGGDGSLTSFSFNHDSVTSLSSQHIESLTLANGSSLTMPKNTTIGGPSILRVDAGLSIGSDCYLDISSGVAIIDANAASPSYAYLAAALSTGYANGNWNGDGIRSSAATALTGIGLMVNNGTYASWNGQAIGPNDTLLMYTYAGDANLDGKVDGSDYSLIDNGYTTHATGWANGDFNYDGVIDGTDYALIDNAFNNQGASLSQFTHS